MRYFYTLLLYCLTPIAVLRLFWKSRTNPDYRKRIAERFAYQLPSKPHSAPLWIHTVSVGEFLAIKPLLTLLLTKHPQLSLWITCTTPTGSAQIQQFAQEHPTVVAHSYFPYDTPAIINRFIKYIQPRGIVLMETELWPNLLTIAHSHNISILLTNARLSAKSLRGYYRYAQCILRQPLQALIINAQTRDDARRFRKLGAPATHVSVTPNIKYHHDNIDRPNWITPLQQTFSQFDFVWLAASTHSDEDDIIITAHQQLQQNIPNSLLILAPRHPERRDSIVKLITQAGFNAKLRSQSANITATSDIYMLDTLGELNVFFHLANAAFIGGSLITHGGHNPLEALHAGIPVCFGTSMYNFKAIAAELLTHPFANTVDNAQTLSQILINYSRTNLSEHIHAFNHQHQQVIRQHYQFINTHIPLP